MVRVEGWFNEWKGVKGMEKRIVSMPKERVGVKGSCWRERSC